jgi:hypothetical protein
MATSSHSGLDEDDVPGERGHGSKGEVWDEEWEGQR